MYLMKCLIVVFITHCLLTVLSVAEDEEQSCSGSDVKVFRENGQNASICKRVYNTDESAAFVASFNRSDLPQGFPQDGLQVERPESIDVVSEMNFYAFNINAYYPKLTIIWKPPFTALSKRECTGYLLVCRRKNKNKGIFRLVQLNNSTQRTEKLTYKFIIPYADGNETYTCRVYSMPPPDAQTREDDRTYQEVYAWTPNAYFANKGPGEWAPMISYHPRHDGTLDVKFSLAPNEFNLTHFEIQLINSSHKSTPYRQEYFDTETHPNAPQGVVQFHGLASGDYQVKVWVVDLHRYEDELCQCWILEGSERHCTSICGSSITEWFHVNVTEPVLPTPPPSSDTTEGKTEPEPTTTTTTESTTATPTEPNPTSSSVSSPLPPNSSTESSLSDYGPTIAGAVVGIVLLLAAIIVAVCLYRKKDKVKQFIHLCPGKKPDRQESLGDIKVVPPPSSPDPSTAMTVSPLRRLNVYIMVAGDHSAQLEAAESLATFLQVHCHCNVIYPTASEIRNNGPYYVWFQQNIRKADHILFIDSEGAKMMVQGEINKMAYRSHKFQLESGLFQTGLKHIMNNHEARESILMVSFTGRYCQSDLQAPTTYVLLPDMRDLLCKLHGLSGKSAKSYSSYLPLCVDRIPELDDGLRLIKAIEAVKMYEKSHPDWSQENYGAPTPVLQQVTSIDSGVESQPDRTRSVSNPDLSILSGDSPSSVLDHPTFPSPVSPGNPPSFSKMSCGPEAMPYRTDMATYERPWDGFSVVTIGTDILNGSVAPGQSVYTIQTDPCRESTAGEILPPESASNIHFESLSTALRDLNNYNEQQLYGQRVGKDVQDPMYANTISEEDTHNFIVPPDTFSDTETVIPPHSPLSDIQEDSFSAALQAINDSSEGMFTDDISFYNQVHGGENDSIV